MRNDVTITRNPVLDIARLPPFAALDALQEQLWADLESGASRGVLISSHDVAIVSGFADHGIDTVVDLLVLCLASATNEIWTDSQYGEREMPFEELTQITFDSLRLFLDHQIEPRLRERYLPTLLVLERERRGTDVADVER